MVQQGLKAEGAIQGEGLRLTTLLPAHATREELRYASTYSKGQLLEVTRQNAPGGLVRGRYDVEGVDAKGRVMLRDESGKLVPLDVKKGDTVLFGKWSGTEVKIDGDELLIMKESDIMGVLDK